MTRVKCLGCSQVVEAMVLTETISPGIVRIDCSNCGKRDRLARLLETPGGDSIDLEAEREAMVRSSPLRQPAPVVRDVGPPISGEYAEPIGERLEREVIDRMKEGPAFVDVPVVDGVATLEDGRTADVVRVPIPPAELLEPIRPSADTVAANPNGISAGALLDLSREEVVVPPPAPPGRLEEGMRASDASGSVRWTLVEIARVRTAILAVAARGAEITADDVWSELGPDFPVSKGLAGRLNAAANAGVIESTGRVGISQRTGEHGHGQRLAIWRPK